jgi:hypothetical protein
MFASYHMSSQDMTMFVTLRLQPQGEVGGLSHQVLGQWVFVMAHLKGLNDYKV